MSSTLRLAFFSTAMAATATAWGGGDPPPGRAAAPQAVHLVGEEDAALLGRVQQVVDDWDPRKLRNPYVETMESRDGAGKLVVRKALRRGDLNQFIADVDAAEALGKAFFWEMQAGSDFRRGGGKYVGTACASCHYRFGADARSTNTVRIPYVAWDRYHLADGRGLEFGESPVAVDAVQQATRTIRKPDDLYIPHRRRPPPRSTPRRERAADVEEEEADEDDDDAPRTPLSLIVGSQGVEPRVFKSLRWGNPPDPGDGDWNSEESDRRRVDGFTNYKPEWAMFIEGFADAGTAFRQITQRNSPSVVNAAFSPRLFHDGRAESTFNGFSIFGDFDKRSVIHVRRGDEIVPVQIAISNASLASQAVGPIANEVEMAYLGRTFHDLAAKLLDAPVLGYQKVDEHDSLLSRFRVVSPNQPAPALGLNTTYRALIQRAFRKEWWDGDGGDSEILVDLALANVPKGSPLPKGTLMEANFSLYWGLSILLYETSLVSNEAPFDQMMRGRTEGVDKLWEAKKTGLQPIYIDRVRTTHPAPDGRDQFAFKSGAEVFQRGFRTFMNRGCFECHSGPLFSELYERDGPSEPKPNTAFTLERTLLPLSEAEAIALKLRTRRGRVFETVVKAILDAMPKPESEPASKNDPQTLARRLALELELVRDQAHGDQVRLAQLVAPRLEAAGIPNASALAAAAVVAETWIRFEKAAPTFSGGRTFFGEERRIAEASLLGGALQVEQMPIPDGQAPTRPPLPIEGPLARRAYAFYDFGYYNIGVSPPRYDRGNGNWEPSTPVWDDDLKAAEAQAAADLPSRYEAPRDEAERKVFDKLLTNLKAVADDPAIKEMTAGKDLPDLKAALGDPQLGGAVRRMISRRDARLFKGLSEQEQATVAAAGREVLRGALARVQAAHDTAVDAPGDATQAASGTSGSAYRFDPAWRRRRPDPPKSSAQRVAKGAAGRTRGALVLGPTRDLDEGARESRPRDVSWSRNLPNWEGMLVGPGEQPGTFDRMEQRRSDVHFYSRTRALVQDETPVGFRKPLLHDDEAAFWGTFKTPTLRNVELTPPYMHNGRLQTLRDVLDFYDRAGDVPRDREMNPDKHPEVVTLDMSREDKLAVVFFLMTLTDDRVRNEMAPFDHPELRVVDGYDAQRIERVVEVPAVGLGGRGPGGPPPTFPSGE